MSNRLFARLCAACIVMLGVTNADAQALFADKRDVTGFAARKMIEACLAQAAREGYPIALAVVDSAGYLVSYQSTDGATGNTGVTAQLKAKTAAKFRRPTDELYDRVNKQVNRAPEWMGFSPSQVDFRSSFRAKSWAPSAREPQAYRAAGMRIAPGTPSARCSAMARQRRRPLRSRCSPRAK